MSAVHCGQCTTCCRGQLIMLLQDDAPKMHLYNFSEYTENGVTLRTLNQTPSGECVHVGPTGCTIYEHRPVVCRTYDCRKQFKTTSRNERRCFENKEIWKEARKRLQTLDAEDIAGLGEYAANAQQSFKSMAWPTTNDP